MKPLKLKEILVVLLIVSVSLNVFQALIVVEKRGWHRMLLCEQERILSAEKNLLTSYGLYQTSSTSLVTIHDYGNIVVPVGGGLVYFIVYAELISLNLTAYADFILNIAGNPVAGKHVAITTGTVTALGVVGCAVWLPAGTYDISVLGRVGNAADSASVYGVSAGITSFNDLVASAFHSYSGVGNDISLTVNARTTPVGPLNQAVYALTIVSNQAWGAGLTVQVDGIIQTIPDEDAGTGATGTYAYKLFIPLGVGSSHTITINLSSGSAYASVIACPWILTGRIGTWRQGHSPVTLSFPQLSTIYTNLGSLFYDAAKNAYIGVQKGVSFGASDYYAQGITAIGILSFNYNFTSVSVSIASFIVDGLGGCIENIGVDIA